MSKHRAQEGKRRAHPTVVLGPVDAERVDGTGGATAGGPTPRMRQRGQGGGREGVRGVRSPVVVQRTECLALERPLGRTGAGGVGRQEAGDPARGHRFGVVSPGGGPVEVRPQVPVGIDVELEGHALPRRFWTFRHQQCRSNREESIRNRESLPLS